MGTRDRWQLGRHLEGFSRLGVLGTRGALGGFRGNITRWTRGALGGFRGNITRWTRGALGGFRGNITRWTRGALGGFRGCSARVSWDTGRSRIMSRVGSAGWAFGPRGVPGSFQGKSS